ncbi:MAG: hypothetical protein FH751_16695 [Firmicutes bacterium]|nr:hypothetical protein [Bacillota bacterium]
MRLWHQDLIKLLPRQQLLGQHRECCALRGKGWGKKHETVNYVFKYSYGSLVAYHKLIMDEMENRGYNPNKIWKDNSYRGKKLGYCDINDTDKSINKKFNLAKRSNIKIYNEHDNKYLDDCINNLKNKGIDVKEMEMLLKTS